jgi:glycosyltransferase involved in cell wall biosynthesis
MNNKPLVSIITPAYNSSASIGVTIESVIKQTYENWELIVVDDGSTDSTASIVSNFINQDNRIYLIKSPKNTGMPGRAKNMAILKAAGELIAFIDSDDFWNREKLSIQVPYMVASDIDLCYSGGWYVDNNSILKGEFVPKYTEGWLFNELLNNYEINNQTVILKRKSLFALDEPRFNPDILIGEDYELFMRIARTGKLLALPNKLAFYRVRNDSITRTNIANLSDGIGEVIRWTSEDPILAKRCRKTLCFAKAKEAFYKAQFAMNQGNKVDAFKILRPSLFLDWKYFILGVSTFSQFSWKTILRLKSFKSG